MRWRPATAAAVCLLALLRSLGHAGGGDERMQPAELFAPPHPGEDITKVQWLALTQMPHRYYSFSATTPCGSPGADRGLDELAALTLALRVAMLVTWL